MSSAASAPAVVSEDEFPLLCETCLGSNPLIRMTRQPYAKACKICERAFTVFRWQPGPKAKYKKTELCKTCAKIKNVCQTCVLDLQYGLPVQVRDQAIAQHKRIQLPQSQVGKEFSLEQYEQQFANAGPGNQITHSALKQLPFIESNDSSHQQSQQLLTSSSTSAAASQATSAVTSQLQRLARRSAAAPYYKRNEAHLCSFFARGECNRGDKCIYRHEMPNTDKSLAKQNIQDRYAGVNDPVAMKMLAKLKSHPSGEVRPLEPPSDPQQTTLWVGALDNPQITQQDVQIAFAPFGPMRQVRFLPDKACAFVEFAERRDAETAARALQSSLVIGGVQCKLNWSKGKQSQQPQIGQQQSQQHSHSATFPSAAAPVLLAPIGPPPGLQQSHYPSQSANHLSVKLG